MNKRDVFLFFPCNGNIGGAERRLVRSFSKIMSTEPTFRFVIGLLPVKDIDRDRVKENYRALTDAEILFFDSKRALFRYVKKSAHTCVCYTDCSYRCLPVLLAAKVSRKKRYMCCVDTVGSSQNLKPKLRQYLYNLDVRMSDRIDCLYPSHTEQLKQKFKRKPITCTACSFTDMDVYVPAFPKRKTITFLGRLQEGKGIRLFVEAALNIKEAIRANGFTCEIYGSGAQQPEIEKLINENGCEDIIRLCGHVDSSVGILKSSRIFCSLQPYGNYPSQSLLEAMACGNYCIVTDTSDSHLLMNDSFGTLIEQKPDALSAALIQAMIIPEERYREIARCSREFLHNNHTVDISASYYYQFLNG